MTCLSLRMGTAQPFAHQSIIFETSYGPVGKSLTAKLENRRTYHPRKDTTKEKIVKWATLMSPKYQETGSQEQNYP